MTLENFAASFATTGIPLSFQSFRISPEAPAPGLPRATYSSLGEKNVWADGIPFFSFLRIELKLYTSAKDIPTELRIETFFSSNDIAWKKDESGNSPDSDNYVIKYTLEV